MGKPIDLREESSEHAKVFDKTLDGVRWEVANLVTGTLYWGAAITGMKGEVMSNVFRYCRRGDV